MVGTAHPTRRKRRRRIKIRNRIKIRSRIKSRITSNDRKGVRR
jgi:hypothetical protein